MRVALIAVQVGVVAAALTQDLEPARRRTKVRAGLLRPVPQADAFAEGGLGLPQDLLVGWRQSGAPCQEYEGRHDAWGEHVAASSERIRLAAFSVQSAGAGGAAAKRAASQVRKNSTT